MRRLLWALPLLAAGVIGCSGGGPTGSTGGGPKGGGATDSGTPKTSGDVKRLIILTNGESPFWDAARQGMEVAEKDLKLADAGLRAVFEVNDGTEEGQLNRLRQYASQSDVAAVGVSVVKEDNAAIADQLSKMQKQGIAIVTIDSDVNRSRFRDARFAYVGTDNIQAGRELGRCAKMLRPEGGEYVSFVGFTTAQNAKERVQGFKEGAGDKFVSKDNMGDNLDRVQAKENVRTARINHPKVNTLVGIWSYNAPAIVGVLEADAEQAKKRTVTVVTFDAEPIALKKMGEGWIDAMAVQNPYMMGYEGTRLMAALARKDDKTVKEILPKHGQPDGDLLDTGVRIVVPDSGSPLKAADFDGKDKNVKGYTLSGFNEWLKKYNLKQS